MHLKRRLNLDEHSLVFYLRGIHKTIELFLYKTEENVKTCILCFTRVLFEWYVYNDTKSKGGRKKTQLFRGYVPLGAGRGGGSTPISLKNNFFL